MTYVGQSAAAASAAGHGSGDTSRDVVAAYVGLTKPRVIELLLLTTVPVMFFAARGVPPLGPGGRHRGRRHLLGRVGLGASTASTTATSTSRCGAPAAGRCRATSSRPGAALVFGLVLGVLSTVILAVWVNPLSAVLAVAANAFYVFVYTMVLKRRTTQNIVWGGLAGCFPALIGWTAVTGGLSWVAGRAVRGGVLLDPAAHLGARAALPRGLRGRRRADAAGGEPAARSAARSWSTAG